jgi:hypothetical protein
MAAWDGQQPRILTAKEATEDEAGAFFVDQEGKKQKLKGALAVKLLLPFKLSRELHRVDAQGLKAGTDQVDKFPDSPVDGAPHPPRPARVAIQTILRS